MFKLIYLLACTAFSCLLYTSSVAHHKDALIHGGSSGIGKHLLDGERAGTVLHERACSGHIRVQGNRIRPVEGEHAVVDDCTGAQGTACTAIPYGERSRRNGGGSAVGIVPRQRQLTTPFLEDVYKRQSPS